MIRIIRLIRINPCVLDLGRALFARVALGTVLLVAAAHRSNAQLSPNADWHTIRTSHFYVHFTPPLESLARRMAPDAERAYAQLSNELHPPRGMIDLVVSDDADLSNGYATPDPTNRIVVYANPPVDESALRFTNDWAQMVVTHELTHIFHLDRVRGIWAIGQHIFGRAPNMFPNEYDPRWLTEGLAVYEESKLAGAGRVLGSEHRMIARASAIDHTFPAIGSVSLAAGRFPFGEMAYAYGSLFVDYLARTRGEADVRRFVEKSSAQVIPYLIDIPSKEGFGVSFSDAWRQFRDSVQHSLEGVPRFAPLWDWRQLTSDGVFVAAPRWLNDSSLIYSGAPGRESYGAFRVDLNGRRVRVGRRNSQSANVRLPDGSLLYSQLDYVNPYQLRSDLWIQRGGHERQLTHDARLTEPDARADGAIVAAEILPGATRLVRVSSDGRRITPLTSGSYDEQWTEPRWSHRGDRIAASRWLRGNVSQIVVLDTTGRIVHIVSSGHSIEATPSWLPDDDGILYSSDRTGDTQVYLERFDAGDMTRSTTYRVSSAATGLFEPQAGPQRARSTETAQRIAAVLFKSDGYHLGVGACCEGDSTRMLQPVPAYLDTTPAVSVPVVVDSAPATKYSPWRTLAPRYWLPTIQQGMHGGYRLGATTTGSDVVGRHTYDATLYVPTDNTGITGSFTYRYSGLGLPLVDLSASQDWEWLGNVYSRDANRTVLGEVRRRIRDADLLATWLRLRARTSWSFTAGAGVEHDTNISLPDSLLPLIDSTGGLGAPTFPRLIAAFGYSNYQRPPYSISPEDGIQLRATTRDRLKSGFDGRGGSTLSTVGTLAAYKSLDLPGFAHHVIAVRAAAGFADQRANGYYLVGGTSGSTFEIIPGYTVGEGPRTFFVRGFAPGTVFGTRALTASAEYRLPLFLTGRGLGVLPFFLDRSSLNTFVDWGTAWCPDARPNRETCGDPLLTQHLGIASVGTELNVTSTVLSWDDPYRFRLGVAVPTLNGQYFGQRAVSAYVAVGLAF